MIKQNLNKELIRSFKYRIIKHIKGPYLEEIICTSLKCFKHSILYSEFIRYRIKRRSHKHVNIPLNVLLKVKFKLKDKYIGFVKFRINKRGYKYKKIGREYKTDFIKYPHHTYKLRKRKREYD